MRWCAYCTHSRYCTLEGKQEVGGMYRGGKGFQRATEMWKYYGVNVLVRIDSSYFP